MTEDYQGPQDAVCSSAESKGRFGQRPLGTTSSPQTPRRHPAPNRTRFLRRRKSLRIALIGIFSLAAQASVDAGSIAGEVKLTGGSPKPAHVKITKDQDYCGQTIPDETYVIGPKGGLKNVVVFIEQPLSTSPPSRREHILDNSGCRFVPRVMAMIKGEKLIIKNSDPKLHIVHPYLEQRTVFTLTLPFRGQHLEVTQRIKTPGLLHVRCDSHAWMQGYIHVFDHPFFAVTGEGGDFHIADVPEGKYTLKAWHEAAGIQMRDLTVGGIDQVEVRFGFTAR